MTSLDALTALTARIGELEAENARLARGGETLGRGIEQQSEHDKLRAENQQLRDQVAAVAALADKWAEGRVRTETDRSVATDLHAALTDPEPLLNVVRATALRDAADDLHGGYREAWLRARADRIEAGS